MLDYSDRSLQHFSQIGTNLNAAFTELAEEVTAPVCSPLFHEQLRRVAYRPDGLSEFLYAPGGVVKCSTTTNLLDRPISLGPPDFRTPHDTDLWVDRGLAFAGLSGLVGTIALREPFAIVVPPQKMDVDVPSWLDLEVVLVAADGQWWHRGGQPGLYEAAHDRPATALDVGFRDSLCLKKGIHCAITQASPLALLAYGWAYAALVLVTAALISTWFAARGRAMVRRYWSFEARFIRHLGPESIACVYQPIMDLATGRIAGCEVLARWHDVDGSVVYPDRFIPLVEKNDLTLRLTRLVVERACADLAGLPATDGRMFVTFNIFPRDLDYAALAPIFAGFAVLADRFDIIVELVESDAVVMEHAQHEIQALREIGIRTFIDDFGTGYSNIQNLAALSVDGVKLDRAFAMAPQEGMMARMLGHAIGMIHTSGRLMVVEGVESEERLQLLRAIRPPVDYVQGYYISRPLDIGRLGPFLQARLDPVALAA